MDYGLGRRFAPDDRDNNHLMATFLAAAPRPIPSLIEAGGHATQWKSLIQYYDDEEFHFNQSDTPQCVEYAWHHYMVDGPIKYRPAPVWQFGSMYVEFQKVDEWEGEDYEGTSVRAGAKVLQARGLIGEYFWAWDADTVVRSIIQHGPVVVGTNFYNDMFYPDEEGLVKVSGGIAGGHAFELNGASLAQGLVRFKNSWGRDWGLNGHAYMSMSDLDRLLKEDGEACLAIEVSV